MSVYSPLHAAFLTLLRAGLWEKEPDDLSLFPLSDKDWKELFHMARWQAVTGVVYRGVCRLADGLLPPQQILLQWTVAIDRIERRNRQLNKVLVELYALWKTEQIVPVLQKGQGVALFYEEPLLRESGDIDLYFGNKELEKRAVAMISRYGVAVRRCPDGSLYYRWKGVDVEHHDRLADIYNPLVYHRLKELEGMEKRGRIHLASSDGRQDMEVPSPLLNLILLDTHILKHALGRGIGLRQLCDMARACYCLRGQISAGQMKQITRQLGLCKWNRLLYAFMVEHLGLPVDCLPYPVRCRTSRPLWNVVWKGGNFGMYPGGKKMVSGKSWKNKLNTLRAFVGNVRFSCSYAPKETFWIVINLLRGQFSRS